MILQRFVDCLVKFITAPASIIDDIDGDNRFEEGANAFWTMMNTWSFTNPENPYPPGTREHEEWDTGFEDAYWYWSNGY